MLVTMRLTRWNEPVLQVLEDAPNMVAGVGAGAAGTELLGDVGRLMVTEGAAAQLWVVYTYGAAGQLPKAAMATMRPGWHFLAAFLEQDDHDGGTDPAVKPLTIRCARVYNPATGSFIIYDQNMAAVAGQIPN